MLFEEDPFDRWCRPVVAIIVYVPQMIGLVLWWVLTRLRIRGRYLLIMFWLNIQSVWTHLYWRHLTVWLVVLGLKKPLTWAEVEAYRLRVVASTGEDIPRPASLEEGLQQEERQRLRAK